MHKTPQQYLDAYNKLHTGAEGFLIDGKSYGGHDRLFDGSNFVTKLYDQFQLLIKDRTSVRVLDYGCGKAEHLHKASFPKGTLFQQHPGKIQTYYCYDPGYHVFREPPARGSKFDIIICADVMEHVPEESVMDVLLDIRVALGSGGAVLFTINGKPAKKSFLDGENLHCTVKPLDWWTERLKSVFKGCAVYVVYEHPDVNIKWKTPAYDRVVGTV